MSLNRHNPFVASLASLVEPAPAAPAPTPAAAESAAPVTFLERIEDWAAHGQTHAGAPEAPSDPITDEAAIEVRTFKLFPYYY